MKILIFAGGAGTRLWPLSRKSFPKQFKKMFDGKSTLQLAVDRVTPKFGSQNIYVSTNENYTALAKEQLPQIPNTNIVGEPTKRDLSAAIGYNFIRLKKFGYTGPVAILWSDHLMKNPESFVSALEKGEKLIKENPRQLVFIGEHARYAENNLGWIHVGQEIQTGVREFVEWIYRPDVNKCEEIYTSGNWRWNPGYFIVDLDFTLELYEKFLPDMYKNLIQIGEAVGTVKENEILNEMYPKLEMIHFDTGIVEKVPPENAVVIDTNMGWSDPGTLYALKEALVGTNNENYESGLIYSSDTVNSLLINEDENKLLATLGIDGLVVVNTKDALIIVPKEKVREITQLVKELESNEKLAKYV